MANPITRWIDKRIDAKVERGIEEGLKARRRTGPSIGVVMEGETEAIPTIMSGGDEDALSKASRLAVTSAWAMSDIRLIGNEFSRAPFNVVEETGEGESEIEAHPFEVVLQRPNKFMGRSFLWQATNWWLQLRGEAYWMLVPDMTGEMVEIWPLPASRVRPIPDPQRYIVQYGYTPRRGGREQLLDAEYVCFFKFFNPFDFHRGLSPLSAANSALTTDFRAARWNEETFENDVTLRTVISVDKDINPVDFERIKADLVDELVSKRLRYLITAGSDIDVEQLGLSQKDLEYITGREFSRDEIDRVFGVPPAYWAAATTTKASAEAAKAVLIESTVYPLHVLCAEFITTQIIIPRYGENLRGKFEDIRPRDRALVVQERKVNWQVTLVNEAREEQGKPPLPEDDPRGNLLVPEVRPSFGGGGLFGSEDKDSQDQDTGGKEAKADLRRWEKIARRLARDGKDPASYDFESDYIDPLVSAGIKTALIGATTDKEVEAAFAAGFQGDPWQDYG